MNIITFIGYPVQYRQNNTALIFHSCFTNKKLDITHLHMICYNIECTNNE